MAGNLIGYARFVEVQQRRVRIVAELGKAHRIAASRTRFAPIDEFVEASQPPVVTDGEITRATADVR